MLNKKSNFFKLIVVAAVFAVAFAFSTIDTQAASFKDVTNPNDYYYNAVMELSDREVINGYNDGTFRPGNHVTRAEAAKIIATALDLDVVNVTNPYFTDVPTNDWAYPYIAAVAKANIVSGYTDGSFRPKNTIKRQEVAKMISVAFELTGSSTLPFTDVPDWAKEYVQALYDNGVTKGVSTTSFGSGNFVKRQDLAVFVVRAENVNSNDPGENPGQGEDEDFGIIGIE